jgi:acetyltransferase-like isoleucine patch superfamily enzyme
MWQDRLVAALPRLARRRGGTQEARMSTLDRLVARMLVRWLREPLRQVLAEQDPRQAGPQAHVEMYKYLVHGDRARLRIHPTAVVNNALFNVGSGDITVGEYAFFGHNVSVLTGTHDITKFGRERQLAIPRSGRDIVIGEGAWLASNVLVLGPCVIGAHAVVGGGSLVLGDVEPYTIVAGSPAKVLRTIPHEDRDQSG